MTVAGISMVEYVSKEAADDFEPKYSEVAPKSIPEADNLILVRTAETSGMSVAIFKGPQRVLNTPRGRDALRYAGSATFAQPCTTGGLCRVRPLRPSCCFGRISDASRGGRSNV